MRLTTQRTARETLSAFRIELGRQSLWAFHKIYRYDPQHVDGGRFMWNFCSWIDEAMKPNGRLVAACPREHMKTELGTTTNVVRAICYGTKRNIGIIAANDIEAANKLRNIVTILEENKLIQADFGEAVTPKLDTRNRPLAAKDREVIFANGVRVFAMGVLGKIRGQNVGGRRVDLLIFDDPEEDKTVQSDEQRKKLFDWLNSACMASTGTGASAIWLGTILHNDSMLSRMLRQSAWPQRAFLQVWNHNREPLWPQFWPVERIEARRTEIGPRMFSQEYMNIPVADEEAAFKPEWWRYFNYLDLHWDNTHWYLPDYESPNAAPLPLSVYIAVDPAISQQKDADYFGLIVMARQHVSDRIFLLDLVEGRFTFDQQVQLIVQKADKWHPLLVRIESQGYAAALSQKVFDMIGYPIEEVKQHINKEARIRASAVHVERGRFYLPENMEMSRRFCDQAESFPRGIHDDLIDCYCMAAEKCAQQGTMLTARSSRKRIWSAITDGMVEQRHEFTMRRVD